MSLLLTSQETSDGTGTNVLQQVLQKNTQPTETGFKGKQSYL